MDKDLFNRNFYCRIDGILKAKGRATKSEINDVVALFDYCDLRNEESEKRIIVELTALQWAEKALDVARAAATIKRALNESGLEITYND